MGGAEGDDILDADIVTVGHTQKGVLTDIVMCKNLKYYAQKTIGQISQLICQGSDNVATYESQRIEPVWASVAKAGKPATDALEGRQKSNLDCQNGQGATANDVRDEVKAKIDSGKAQQSGKGESGQADATMQPPEHIRQPDINSSVIAGK